MEFAYRTLLQFLANTAKLSNDNVHQCAPSFIKLGQQMPVVLLFDRQKKPETTSLNLNIVNQHHEISM